MRAPAAETLQRPLQVMLHVPAEHATFEPAPTVCVHDAPAQVMLQLGPQVPEQVEPAAQLSAQPAVDAEQASNVHDVFAGQLQLVPAQ